jgi:adenosylcobinamide kinase/adenosylcobinamide-phosphate guanylyltransferase
LQYNRQLTFVLGGARSGKSRHAERLLVAAPEPWIYVATAEIRDEEMRSRIEVHRKRRGPDWKTIEEPLELTRVIVENARERNAVLVDCLTLWLSNIMLAGRDPAKAMTEFVAALPATRGNLVLVSNEVGMGIVPDNRLGREFRDAQGELNRMVAGEADRVIFVAAGLPVVLK